MSNAASIRYALRQPFDRALRSVRDSLVCHGLRIVGQADLARRVERALGIVLPPCRIVFVLPERGLDPASGAYLPLHVVVAAQGEQTEIQVLNRVHPDDTALVAAVVEVRARTCQAIESIAMRRGVVT